MSDNPESVLVEASLHDLAEMRRGITYKASELSDECDGLPYFNMKSFQKGGGLNPEGTKFFNSYFSQADLIGPDDLLIANTDVTSGDIVGVPALVPIELREYRALYSHHVTRLRILTGVQLEYLYYLLCLPEYRRKMLRIARGTTVLMLDMLALGRLTIGYPRNQPAQQKIARILQTVDRAMEKTEALIEKYQQIKAGLMHDLFTRGLWTQEELDRGDHHGTPAAATAKPGQLRPTCQDAPHLYQQTPIGWIPKAWASEFLEALLAPVSNNLRSGPFGSALLKSELVEDGIPFLGIDNIHVEKFVAEFRRFIDERKYRSLIKYSVRPKDVVITIMGTVGRSAIIPQDIGPALSSKHLWTMTFDQEKVLPELICWQLNYASWVKSWFRRETQGGIMDAIQSKTLRTLRLPVPPPEEQIEIKKRYDAVSSKLKGESLNLAKLQKQKSGLMHDLLTGKVPVTPNPKEASDV